MAITWRNIGQASNQGNSLISGAADTITEGLGSIRNAAREVSQEQIRQYNVQGDTNTADILNQIQNSNDPSRFNIDDLTSQFGNQFDAGAVTGAIGDRTKELRGIARNQFQNTLAQSAENRAEEQLTLDKAKTTSSIALNNQRIEEGDATLAQQRLAREKQDQIKKFSNSLLESLPEYGSEKELRNAVIKRGKDENLTTAEIGALSNEISTVWNQSIGSSDLQPAIEQAKLQGQQESVLFAQEAQRKLDIKAKTDWGLNPVLLNISTDTSVDENEVYANYDAKAADANAPWKEDNTEYFKTQFTKMFQRAPTGAEAKYFLALAFEEGAIFGLTDEGLNQDLIETPLKEYKAMLEDSDKVTAYREAKDNIRLYQQEFDKNAANQIRKIQRQQVKANQDSFKGLKGNPVTPNDLDLRSAIPDKLKDTSWIYNLGKSNPSKPKDASTVGGFSTNVPEQFKRNNYF